MIIGVYGFLSNVNKSSVNIFITTMNSSVTEASTCTMKYFNGLNDIRLISRPIHAPIYIYTPLELSREFLSGNWQFSTNPLAVQTTSFFLFWLFHTYGLYLSVLCCAFISYFYAAAIRVAAERLRVIALR